MFKRTHFKFQKRYVAFFSIVPLLIASSLIKIDCPVCGGTGDVSATPAMEHVVITSSTADQQTNIVANSCYMYVMYLYNFTVAVRNDNTDAISGYLEFDLKDAKSGKPLDVEYLALQMGGKSAVQNQYPIWFKASGSAVTQTQATVEVMNSALPCQTCGGTGKISLDTWLLANALKQSVHQLSQTQTTYVPPPYNPPDIEDIEAANN